MSPNIELSPEQEKIVSAEEGPIYVEARAGSGKTRVLTERIKYLLGKTKKRILALTFTHKAGEEIRQRLHDVPNLHDRLFVGTFHSFCQYVLENHGNLIGLSKMPDIFEKEADRLELVEQAVQHTPFYGDQYRNQTKKDQQNFCYNGLRFIEKVKRKLIDPDFVQHADDGKKLILLYQTYQDILRSQNAIDFDDLLLLTYTLFIDNQTIAALYRRSYYAICIDEAQDLNHAQYQLLRAFTHGEYQNIMMVGDPEQAIFHFIGSSTEFMSKRFVEDFKPTIFKLTKNYRSSQEVLKVARKFLAESPETDKIDQLPKKGLFELHSFENDESEALWIVNKINKLIELKHDDDIEGEICYEKIIILARNKYVFDPLELKLKEQGIPFYYKMTLGNIEFESDLMKLFDLAFRIRLNPQDALHKNKLCKVLDVKEQSDLEEILIKAGTGMKKRILEIVRDLKEDGSNLRKLFEILKGQLDTDGYISDDDDNERKMISDDIDELLKNWSDYAKKTDRKSLYQFKNAMALGQTQPLVQHQGITLSTVHSMKGQESDIVFLMGMDEGTFPDYRAIKNNGLELIQEKNNLYVALTRAKRFLYVTWPRKRHMPWGVYKDKKISRFLETMYDDR